MSDFIQNFILPTKTVYVEWVILAVIVVCCILATHKLKEVPGLCQNVAEVGVGRLYRFFDDIMGIDTKQFFPLLGTMFIFIVFCNYTGELPFAGEAYPVATSGLGVTCGLGLVAFVVILLSGVKRRGPLGYLKTFISPLAFMLPINLIELVIRPISLSLRLYGNIYGEEQVTSTLYEIFPIGLPWVMNILSLLFCLIQAMVFTMLLSIFIKEAIETEEE